MGRKNHGVALHLQNGGIATKKYCFDTPKWGLKKNGKHGWPESQATSKQFSTKRVRTHLPYQVPSLQWHDNVMAISPRIQIEVDHMGKVVHGQAAKSLSICLKANSSVAMECLGLGWFCSRLSCDGQNMGKTQNFCVSTN